jgi:CheY-like chemotaxis protein
MRRPLILVVDDTEDNREMYVEYLQFVGFTALAASDGASAIDIARRSHPSIVLMDLSLPGTDGCEATRILKADPATQDIKIVALTGHADASDRARALMAGCDLFISKPCLPKELAEQLTLLLDPPTKGKERAR